MPCSKKSFFFFKTKKKCAAFHVSRIWYKNDFKCIVCSDQGRESSVSFLQGAFTNAVVFTPLFLLSFRALTDSCGRQTCNWSKREVFIVTVDGWWHYHQTGLYLIHSTSVFGSFFFFNQQIFVTVSVPSTVCYREIKTCQGCCSQSAYRQVYFSTQSCYNLSRDTRITALPAQQRPGSSYLTPQLILPGFPCFYGTLGMSWGCY